MALSFNSDIRAMFRELDVEQMIGYFDLSKYDDVKSNAESIYERLADGTMPCDDAWPDAQIAKFKMWIDEGMAE